MSNEYSKVYGHDYFKGKDIEKKSHKTGFVDNGKHDVQRVLKEATSGKTSSVQQDDPR